MDSTLLAGAAQLLLATVVAPVLLYRQNERSSQREAKSRADERSAGERREALALEEQRRASGLAAGAAAKEAERERYVSFFRAVTEVTTGIMSGDTTGRPYEMKHDTQLRLAQAFEAGRIGAPDEVGLALESAMSELRRLLKVTAEDGTDVIGDIYRFDDIWLRPARQVVQTHLSRLVEG